MTVLQAISVGLSERRAHSMAPAMASGSWPSMRCAAQPEACEALDLVVGHGQRGRPVDGDRVVVEQHDQLVELEVAGERDRLLADALHQAAVAGDARRCSGRRCRSPSRALSSRSASAMPTALPRPWPSGPVVVSMPGAWPYSGWPAVLEPSWRKLRELLHRHAGIAGQMQQRVEQHRAVAGREHEAVAVRPIGRGGVELQEPGEQHGRHVGHAHRHAGMARLGLLHGIHGERPDGVRHVLVRHGAIRAHLHRRFATFAPPSAVPREPGALAVPMGRVYLCGQVLVSLFTALSRTIRGCDTRSWQLRRCCRSRSSARPADTGTTDACAALCPPRHAPQRAWPARFRSRPNR